MKAPPVILRTMPVLSGSKNQQKADGGQLRPVAGERVEFDIGLLEQGIQLRFNPRADSGQVYS
jgi:hypothetical protein